MAVPAVERINRWKEVEDYYWGQNKWLHRLVRSRGASHADAEDIVQETMLKALEYDDRIQSFRGWCRKVALRLWRDTTRQRRRRDVGLDEAGNAIAGKPSFEEMDVWRRFLVQWHELPEKQRVVVAHRYWGFSNSDIAKVLGVTPSTVASHLRHAKPQIRFDSDR